MKKLVAGVLLVGSIAATFAITRNTSKEKAVKKTESVKKNEKQCPFSASSCSSSKM